jgi:hypothetical protein
VLPFGSFIDVDGNRAAVATQVEGVLAATVDSDFLDSPDSLSGQIAIYTSGRFIWPAVREANPAFVFDPVAINTLKAKGITFESDLLGLWQPLGTRALSYYLSGTTFVITALGCLSRTWSRASWGVIACTVLA